MKNRWRVTVVGILLYPVLASAQIYFQQNFDEPEPYNFTSRRFGYSNNPITTFHEATGGVHNSGTHHIPLGGPSRRNFDVHFGITLAPLSEYYLRFYLWVNPTFNHDPGENWKLTYNYYPAGSPHSNFVFWFSPGAGGNGLEPVFWVPEYVRVNGHGYVTKLENVPTFYLRDFKGQWLHFEYYVNIPNGDMKLWISTEDGRYNETLYIDQTNITHAAGSASEFKVGAYWDGTGDDNYFKLDDIVISDTYNGPLTAPTGPRAPANVRAAQ